MKVSELGEFGLIERFAKITRVGTGVLLGIGDDCAVVQVRRRRVLLTTDTLIENVHFRSGWDSAEGLGRKTFAVNASDVAAMGGLPRFALLSVAVPGSASTSDLEQFHRGFTRAARVWGCSVVGGNMSRSDVWMITVTLVGEPSGKLLTRNGARVGDALYVSGVVGAAGFGRELLLRDGRPRPSARLTEAFRRPTPRLVLGQTLARRGLATAAIDVSDGLIQDLGHLCRASGVGALVEVECLPLAPVLQRLPRARALSLALAGGEDYELLFTIPPARERRLEEATHLGVPIRRIGRIVSGRGVKVVDADGRELLPAAGGFDHFSRR